MQITQKATTTWMSWKVWFGCCWRIVRLLERKRMPRRGKCNAGPRHATLLPRRYQNYIKWWRLCHKPDLIVGWPCWVWRLCLNEYVRHKRTVQFQWRWYSINNQVHIVGEYYTRNVWW
jgi:hypothetical protein